MNGVTPEQGRDFYRAAASFYRQAPWRSTGEEETIKVSCPELEGGPWYAFVLGKVGKLKGLMLCDDRESRLLLDRGEYAAIAERLRNITLYFGDRGEISQDDLNEGKRYGFEVAGPDAYPVVFRMEQGREFRNPNAWELELLEACLWVIPDFLKRAKDRNRDVLEYAFKGMIGKMTFDLSWVPREPLRTDRPGRRS